MKITININTGNAAFEDNENELYDILVNQVAAKLWGTDQTTGNLMDSNGNKVGDFKVTGK